MDSLKRAYSIINKYIVDNYKLIDVKGGKCRFNFRCHSNAVHEAIERDDDFIAIVMYIDGDCPITHFINCKMDKKSQWKFKDNTLGNWSSQFKYYLVGYIPKHDFFKVYDYHRTQMDYMRSLLPWYIKIFTDFKT